jgi:hypothetical protein
VGIGLLLICDWSNLRKRDTEIPFPAWTQVEEAIRALDNKNLNDLYLTPQTGSLETFLGIGGGAGRYLVTGSNAGNSFPTLLDSESTDSALAPLLVGGQLGEYPRHWIVSLDAAVGAARAFYDVGGFDCGVRWAYPHG